MSTIAGEHPGSSYERIGVRRPGVIGGAAAGDGRNDSRPVRFRAAALIDGHGRSSDVDPDELVNDLDTVVRLGTR
jgi:hypothetical protein